MSRFLTPSKISLLTLISLYSDCTVPSAAIIPILSFVVSFLIPGEFSDNQQAGQKSREVCFSIEKLQNATITHASGIPGRTIWDLLLKRLWEISNSDALHTFFDDLTLILENAREGSLQDERQGNPNRLRLSRTSPCGAFVRRSQLEFTRLQFHDVIGVWKSFVAFREPTFTFWKKRNPNARKGVVALTLNEELLHPESTLAALVDGPPPEALVEYTQYSADDVEKLLEYQINQMQSKNPSIASSRMLFDISRDE